MRDWWVVAVDLNDDDINPHFYVVHGSYNAMKIYKKAKEELKEWVNDTGFTGDEGVWIASIKHGFEPVPVEHDDEGSFHFEWNEETEEGFYLTKDAYEMLLRDKLRLGPCDYCKSIEEATPASPRHDYNFCPKCGRFRK